MGGPSSGERAMIAVDRPLSREGRVYRAWDLVRRAAEAVRRAFKEFLTTPSIVIGGFLLLAIGTYFLDRARIGHDAPSSAGLFSDAQAARAFLGVIAPASSP